MTVDTGKHTESTADQAPRAELLLMEGVLAQSAIATNGTNAEESNNESSSLAVFV